MLHFALAALALNVGVSPRCPPVVAVAAPTAGEAVAHWCVSSGRSDAAVAVSPASTLEGAMADFWLCAYQLATEDGPVGRQRALTFPFWKEGAQDASLFQSVIEHIFDCAEISEFLGQSMIVAGRHPTHPTSEDEPMAPPHPIITLRSYSQKEWGDYSAENFGEADPFAQMDVPDDGIFESTQATSTDADSVIARSGAWVDGVVAKMKDDVAGMQKPVDPEGGIEYTVCRRRTAEEAYEYFWRQCGALTSANMPGQPESVFMSLPNFAPYNAGGFEAFANTLNSAITDLDLGSRAQLIFFHPQFSSTVEDKQDDEARFVEFARSSPHPSVALLRTPMVEQARAGMGSEPVSGCIATCALIEVHERLCGPEGGLCVSKYLRG